MYIRNSNSTLSNFNAIEQNFIAYRGDTFKYAFEAIYYNNEGEETPYDFSNLILKMHIKRKKTDTEIVATVEVSYQDNIMSIGIPLEIMQNLIPFNYHYDVEIFDVTGSNITILYGRFKVLQDVTYFEKVTKYLQKITFNNKLITSILNGIIKKKELNFNSSVVFNTLGGITKPSILILKSTVNSKSINGIEQSKIINLQTTLTITVSEPI